MRCFFACFNAGKHRKRKHLVNITPSNRRRNEAGEALQISESTKQEITEEPFKPVLESSRLGEEQLGCYEKKVTFDLNVETYEAVKEVTNNEGEKSENKEESSNQRDLSPENIASDVVSLPVNHRYQNFENEEYEGPDLEDSDVGGDGDDPVLVQGESSESLFSLSIDSKKDVCGNEIGEKEVTSPMTKSGSPKEELKGVGSNKKFSDRTPCVDSALSSLENLSPWEAVKAKSTLPWKHNDKENIYVEQEFNVQISPEPTFKILKDKDSKENTKAKKFVDHDTAVDTSLSSWLAEVATTPMSNGSANSIGNAPSGKTSTPISKEDRPILGALTIEELRQISASNTPRCLRSRSPDETPIIGTVGSYWIHTGRTMDSDSSSSSRGKPNTISKHGEDEKVKCNSTSFEARLERALDSGIAQV